MFHGNFHTDAAPAASPFGSFPGPPGPYSFFYRPQLTNRWSTMANVWYDIPLNCRPLEVYIGGGLGYGGGRIISSDSVVTTAPAGGDPALSTVAYGSLQWQLGCGVTYHYSNQLAFEASYRYQDMGGPNVRLRSNAGNTDAGTYSLDTTGHQFLVGIRFKSLRDFMPSF